MRLFAVAAVAADAVAPLLPFCQYVLPLLLCGPDDWVVDWRPRWIRSTILDSCNCAPKAAKPAIISQIEGALEITTTECKFAVDGVVARLFNHSSGRA